jgi:uroporphyrinogen-III synthase
VGGTAKQEVEKSTFAAQPLKGEFDFERLAASLKRYPDTKLEFFRSLESRALLKTIDETRRAPGSRAAIA